MQKSLSKGRYDLKEIKNNELVFTGFGFHTMSAAFFAKETHAPKAKISFEIGIIDTIPNARALSFADPKLWKRCAKSCGIFYCLSLLQKGYVDIGLIQGAEVDKYGNVNSTVIGDYRNPKIRLPGSGGANDFASNAKRTVILMPHKKEDSQKNFHI